MLNTNEMPKKKRPSEITMQDAHNNIVVIPIEQENQVNIFKSMGYREVHLDTEVEQDDDQQ